MKIVEMSRGWSNEFQARVEIDGRLFDTERSADQAGNWMKLMEIDANENSIGDWASARFPTADEIAILEEAATKA